MRTSYAKRTSKEHRDVYSIVTEKVIEILEQGTIPWRQPWNATSGSLPLSLSTKKPYRGVNVLLLGVEALDAGYQSPWWGTYNKIKEIGGHPRTGVHATLVTYWGTFMKHEMNAVTGKIELVKHFFLRYYRVFNSDQIEWDDGKEPQYAKVQATAEQRIEEAERILRDYPNRPIIKHGGSRAFYQPGSVDVITLPPFETFECPEEYYSTAFHEATHSTGHDSRLARDGVRTGAFGKFGDPVYSREELVAEMGAAMLTAIAGIDNTRTLPNSAAYLAHWIGVLKEDSKLVVQAAAHAQHAVDHILDKHYENKDEGEEA